MVDLTSFGQAPPNHSQPRQAPRRAQPVSNSADEFVPNAPKPSTKQGLWDIDSVAKDGQVVAGEVDKAHQEFLKQTTFVE